MFRTLLSFSLLALPSLSALCAQQDAAPPVPPPALPAAGSDAARGMVDQAFAKMLAYGRGMFTSRESHDLAFVREAGIPLGAGETELSAGWQRDLVFGEWLGCTFVRGNGRVLSERGGHWHVAADRLIGGKKLPFTIDPELLFTVLVELPVAQRKVVHVEAGAVDGRDVVILTMQLSGSDAHAFADHGVVPVGSSGFDDVVVFGGLGAAFEPKRAEQTTYLACFVDAQNGDLLRLGVRTVSSGGAGGLQIAIGGGFPGGDDDEDDDDDGAEDDAEGRQQQPAAGAAAGPVGWKEGFPAGKPGKGESVMTFTVDFTKLGLADVPAIEDALKHLVGAR